MIKRTGELDKDMAILFKSINALLKDNELIWNDLNEAHEFIDEFLDNIED